MGLPISQRRDHEVVAVYFSATAEALTLSTITAEEDFMARSIRVLYRGVQGRVRRNFNWQPINLDSPVIITAAEFVPHFGGVGGGPRTLGRPNLGEANVYVTNVGPHGVAGVEAGGVEFHLHVDFDSPLDVVVTITVPDDIEEFVQA
jgi:hypothetical protein